MTGLFIVHDIDVGDRLEGAAPAEAIDPVEASEISPSASSEAADTLAIGPGDGSSAPAWLHDFGTALRLGDTRTALAVARDACLADPARAEAHYAFGQAWMAAGKPDRAEQCFAVAVKLRPKFADAWVNLGLARYAQSAVEDARKCMANALYAQPGHAAALSNLATLLRLSGNYDAAQTMLHKALADDPHAAGARLNLAVANLAEDKPAQALALLNAVDPPADDLSAARHWHLQRASALLALNRPDKARSALAEFDALGAAPPDLAPLRVWRDVALALCEGRGADARLAAEATQTALESMSPAAMVEHRVMAHYGLAKFWSREGDHDRAFSQWLAGHALLRPVQPFSREAAKAFGEAAIASFTPDRYAYGSRAANADATPVFIVGMPRSGTTLTEQIIAAHSQAHGAGERSALGQMAWRLGGGDDAAAVARIAALDNATLDAAATDYLHELHALAPGMTRIVDKMPGNYRHVWLIPLLFPKARIIHCMRDPRDIGLSIFTFRFYGNHGYAHDLADLGWTIGEQTRLMNHWKAVLPQPVLNLRLDDWVQDFDATLARVLDFVGLPPDPACTRFYENDSEVRTVSRAQVRQPVNAQGLGRWHAYAAHLAPMFEELERGGALDDWRDGTRSMSEIPTTATFA